MQPIPTHFVMEGADTDSERFGGFFAVEIARLKYRLDRHFFALLDGFRKRPGDSRSSARIVPNFGGQLAFLDGVFGNCDHHPFDHVSQLANISWPVSGHQGLHCVVGQAFGLSFVPDAEKL